MLNVATADYASTPLNMAWGTPIWKGQEYLWSHLRV